MTDTEYFNGLHRGITQQRAAMMIVESVFEASHHSQWYIDQAMRILMGTGYPEFARRFESHFGEKWEEGIAP